VLLTRCNLQRRIPLVWWRNSR